ncbi:MAG: alpha/beta hydrolase [Clostridia bacterium]|jgi:pimeloyl-ACP methyl ester carboxylesterase
MNILLENAKISEYHGFKRYDFYLRGHLSVVICPNTPADSNKWIWRAEFLGAFDQVDVAMIEKGYYLVYYSISNMFGCPASIKAMKDFYDFAVNEMALSKKTVIFGFSRGGLYAVNFAAAYPAAVSSLYLDAPVLDLKSWPGGMGTGDGSPNEFTGCLKIYGLDNESIKTFSDNSIDKAAVLLENKIPVAIVAGDSDTTVPHLENCGRLAEYYRTHNGTYMYILKEGCGHHPHSLPDPSPVVDFLLQH